MIVVSDSTILIGLAKIEKIALLRSLFQVIYIPEAVFQEVTKAGEQRSRALEVKESERPFPIDLNLPVRCLRKGL